MKQQLLINKNQTLRFTYNENGLPVIPSSAKITIYNNGGTEKVAQIAVTAINPTTGEMTYTVSSTVLTTLDINWRASWEFETSETRYEDQLFDIVNQILSNPIITKDVTKRAPFLKIQNYRKVFTATAGTNTEIESTELNEDPEWWTNGDAEITGGTNQGETRKVISFLDNKLTVAPEFTSAIDNTSICNVIRSYEVEISEAFNIFLNDIRLQKLRSNKIIGTEQIRELVLNKAIELICNNFIKDIADVWALRMEKYAGIYESLFNNLVLDYDANNDGNIQDAESDMSLSQTTADR